MLKTRITEQYGLKVPFINAGMAFIATAPLVRSVCKAGGMGMLGATAMPPDVLQAALRDIKAAGPACFGVNFIARFSGIEHIEVCVTEKAPVVVFFWDDAPDEWLSRLRAAGSHIWFQVGSVDEAKAALRRGAEALVVQGSEAGGHNRAAAATFSLLPAVIDAVPSVPVVAAGGIADGRTVAAALALGADAVWVVVERERAERVSAATPEGAKGRSTGLRRSSAGGLAGLGCCGKAGAATAVAFIVLVIGITARSSRSGVFSKDAPAARRRVAHAPGQGGPFPLEPSVEAAPAACGAQGQATRKSRSATLQTRLRGIRRPHQWPAT